MTKKEFKKLQQQYIELKSKYNILHKKYKTIIKPFEDELITKINNNNDTEEDFQKFVRTEIKIQEEIGLLDVEEQLRKIEVILLENGFQLLQKTKEFKKLQQEHKDNLKFLFENLFTNGELYSQFKEKALNILTHWNVMAG